MGLAAGFATKAAIKVLALADVRQRRIDVDGVCSSNRDTLGVYKQKKIGVCRKYRRGGGSSGCNRHDLGVLQGALKVIGV